MASTALQYKEFWPKTEWKEDQAAGYCLYMFLLLKFLESLRNRFKGTVAVPKACEFSGTSCFLGGGILYIRFSKLLSGAKMVLPKILGGDFQPHLEWTVDEAGGSLLIHVADFQKDRIKVKVDNESMNVLVFGEQPTKQIRFKLTAYIPKTCNSNGVSAILSGGILYITFLNLVDEKTMVMPEIVDVEFQTQRQWRGDQADSYVLIYVPGSMHHMGIYTAKEKAAAIASEVSSGAEKETIKDESINHLSIYQ